jgi:hypothetical protein
VHRTCKIKNFWQIVWKHNAEAQDVWYLN